jgi:uracil-DNA glycosylase
MKPPKEQLHGLLSFIDNQPQGFAFTKENTQEKELPKGTPEARLSKLYKKFHRCQECPLAKQGRTKIVFGKGNPDAQLMFVGEGPGRDEDKQGAPFVGRAGQLLTKIIAAMGLKRTDVFISNVVKCRPPHNRAPLPNEGPVCKKLILEKEIDIIKPKIICTLGATATQAILGEQSRISRDRGKFFEWKNLLVIPTFHPAYALRNPSAKHEIWSDMKIIIEKLGLKAPETKDS